MITTKEAMDAINQASISFAIIGPITRHGTPEDIARSYRSLAVPIELGDLRRRYRAICEMGAPKLVRDAFLRRMAALSRENRQLRGSA